MYDNYHSSSKQEFATEIAKQNQEDIDYEDKCREQYSAYFPSRLEEMEYTEQSSERWKSKQEIYYMRNRSRQFARPIHGWDELAEMGLDVLTLNLLTRLYKVEELI